MIDNTAISTAVETILDKSSALDMLLDFESVFDDLHIYSYANWEIGEIVAGPNISRYWVTVTLMYPASKMPDPVAAKRLTRHGCKVYYKKDMYTKPGKVDVSKSYAAKDTKNKEPIKMGVYLVEVSMPRHFIDEFNTEKLRVNGVDIDMTDVTSAYDQGLDQESTTEEGTDDIE